MHARRELGAAGGAMPMVCAEGETLWRPMVSVPELAWMAGGDPASAAPPSWPLPSAPGSDPLSGYQLAFSDAFSFGSLMLRKHYGLLLAATGITIGVTVVGAGVGAMSQALAGSVGGKGALIVIIGAQIFNWLFSLLVSLPVSIGCVWMVVRMCRGEQSSIAAIGEPFRRLLPILALTILVSVIMVLAAIPGAALFIAGGVMLFSSSRWAGGPLLLAGIVAVLAPLFWLGVRLAPAYLLLLDPRASGQGPLGPIESLSESWRLTKGHAVTLIGIAVIISLIAAVTVMACILPWIFYGNPLYLGVIGATYAMLLHRRGERAQTVIRAR
jgi:hypothetical protein